MSPEELEFLTTHSTAAMAQFEKVTPQTGKSHSIILHSVLSLIKVEPGYATIWNMSFQVAMTDTDYLKFCVMYYCSSFPVGASGDKVLAMAGSQVQSSSK